jgi:serine/threonine protein kinase
MGEESRRDEWRRIEAILDTALDLSGPDLEAFLERSCGADKSLRARIEALLKADTGSGGMLDDPVDALAESLLEHAPDIGALASGTRIGPYRVVREIGHGGMGRVYMADRADGQFEQTVALKLIRKGLSWGELRERFLQERQILAGLQHPNLARLLDGGVTEDGRPYFVMEYVDGLPITDYAERAGLNSGQRLALFRQVCEAVAYAQQRLVVHRDLKPSNILVTHDDEVKLLDFGIARLLGTSEDSHITRFGPRVLTPEYSAPEQVDGGTITTATDVFSLGRVLCELLTSQLTLESTQFPEQKLPRDLAIIIAKATRKDPGDRYASAAELGEDVRRYVDGLPIIGRKPSLAYRTQRFVSRTNLLVVEGESRIPPGDSERHGDFRCADAALSPLEPVRFVGCGG